MSKRNGKKQEIDGMTEVRDMTPEEFEGLMESFQRDVVERFVRMGMLWAIWHNSEMTIPEIVRKMFKEADIENAVVKNVENALGEMVVASMANGA